MSESNAPHTSTPSPGGDGVRVFEQARTPYWSALLWGVLAAAVIAIVAWRLLSQTPGASSAAVSESVPEASSQSQSEPKSTPDATQAAARSSRQLASQPLPATNLPNDDPNDLANYFRPGDPEPTGAELIGALHDVGIHTGMGAFNPPGTSPPLDGLAVPENYVLPDGYVRHHQSTDEGVAIEPILMFSPDFILHDANGNPIAMPANRVVPADLAPPGLPVRWVRTPRP